MKEERFQELVKSWLAESFARVEAEVTLPSGHRVDFVAYTPFHSYVIEVENSWDTIYNGIGQARVYAAETGHEPVVVFPADSVDADDLGIIRSSPHPPRIVTV